MPFRWRRGASFLVSFDGGPWHGSRDLLTSLGGPPDCVEVPDDDGGLYLLAGGPEDGCLPYRWITWARAEMLATSGPPVGAGTGIGLWLGR